MTEPRHIRCPYNPLIRWHAVPMDPSSSVEPRPYPRSEHFFEDGQLGSLEPKLWAWQLEMLFGRVHQSEVGEVLIESVRRTCTVYHGTTSALPDTLHGRGTVEASRLARTIGTEAAMFLDLRREAWTEPNGLPRNDEVSLIHELAHIVQITWGCFVGGPFDPDARRRFAAVSPGEADAWIVENMFRVERGLAARRTYDGDGPLPPGQIPTDQNTGVALGAAERAAVRRFRDKAPGVAARLRALPRSCRYNPFR